MQGSLWRKLETDLAEARRQASELRVQAQTDMADRAELIAYLAAVEQLIDRPVAESGGYHYTVANMSIELVSTIRATLARIGAA
jgi:cytochrome c2